MLCLPGYPVSSCSSLCVVFQWFLLFEELCFFLFCWFPERVTILYSVIVIKVIFNSTQKHVPIEIFNNTMLDCL